MTFNCDGSLTANAGTNSAISLGNGVTIGGSPTASGGSGSGYTYLWSPSTGLSSATVANPTASPTSTTTYSVEVTDANGCTANSSTVTVTVSASISPGQATGIIATGGGPVTVSFAGIIGYSYSVQRSTNLVDWVTIWTTNAPAGGLFNYTDSLW